MGTPYDSHGCSTLNGLPAVCGPRSDRVCADRQISRRVVEVLIGGGGEVSVDRRLGEVPGGCNLISLLVVCTILVHCPSFVRFLALFPFPSFPKLYHTSSYSDFCVYPSGLHKMPLVCVKLRHDLVCITMPLVCANPYHNLVCSKCP